jgi:hypothetical protein
MNMKGSHDSKPRYDARGSWLFITVFGVFALGIVGSMVSPYLADRNERKRANWPQVEGRPVGTRVIKDPPTPRFPTTLYVGECSVEYIVAGRRYTIWAGSGYLDPDLNWITDKLRDCPVPRYAVHYNPRDPSDASAKRWDSSP